MKTAAEYRAMAEECFTWAGKTHAAGATTRLNALIDLTGRFRCFVWCCWYSSGREAIKLRGSVEPDLRET